MAFLKGKSHYSYVRNHEAHMEWNRKVF